MQRWIVLILVAVMLTACGGLASEPTATPPAEPITDIIANDPQLSTLAAVLENAGLVEALSGSGSFTVFAPTNAAFDALNRTIRQAAIDRGLIGDVLTYHVLDGRFTSDDLAGVGTVTTLQGETFPITVTNGTITLDDGAQVVTANIEGSNGVIHIIDTVMLPSILE